MSKKTDSLKKLAVCAMMVALSFVLSLWTPFQFWPQGGSVTFAAMSPVILVSLLFGLKWGLGCAFVNAVLQLLMGLSGVLSWGLSVEAIVGTVVLDYLLAYTVIGLAGMFKGPEPLRAVLGTVTVCLLRYLCHFVSGLIFFGMWAEEGYTPLTWALFYNMTFMLPETIITVVVASPLAALIPVLRKNFAFCRPENALDA